LCRIAWGTYPVDETTIPVLTVTWNTAWELEVAQASPNRTSPLLASITDADGMSFWRVVLSHWSFYAFSYALAAMSIAVVCAAFIRYREFYLAQGGFGPIAIPHVCMILESIGGLLRFIHWYDFIFALFFNFRVSDLSFVCCRAADPLGTFSSPIARIA
jgi:hypothetical protein